MFFYVCTVTLLTGDRAIGHVGSLGLVDKITEESSRALLGKMEKEDNGI